MKFLVFNHSLYFKNTTFTYLYFNKLLLYMKDYIFRLE